jgi:hypothetical protein
MKHEDIKKWVAEQNWNLRDAEIARQTGLSHTTVRQRRMQAGIPKGKKSLLVRSSTWDDVDWTQGDSVIAKSRGVSRQCVNQYRKKFSCRVTTTTADIGDPDLEPLPDEPEILLSTCRHGTQIGDCDACDREADLAFDAARESRFR